MGDIGKSEFPSKVLFAHTDTLRRYLKEAKEPATAQVVEMLDGAKPEGAEWAATKPDNRIQEWEFNRAAPGHQAAILEANQKVIGKCLEGALANVQQARSHLVPTQSHGAGTVYELRAGNGPRRFSELLSLRWDILRLTPSQCTEAKVHAETFSKLMDAMDEKGGFTTANLTAAARALEQLEVELGKSIKSAATISPWSPQ